MSRSTIVLFIMERYEYEWIDTNKSLWEFTVSVSLVYLGEIRSRLKLNSIGSRFETIPSSRFSFSLFVCLLACIFSFSFLTVKSFVNINRRGLSSVRQECSLTRFELKTCLERDPCFFFFFLFSLRNAISVRRKFGWFYSRWIINSAFIHILTVVFFISSPPQLLIPNGIFNYSNLSFTTTTP